MILPDKINVRLFSVTVLGSYKILNDTIIYQIIQLRNLEENRIPHR